jgi:DNA-binding NarL/FixJ family response regulator
LRVLIVDDDIAMRKMLCRLLSRSPSIEATEEAGSGEEAIALIPTFAPDVVTLDAHMPGMSGVEVIKEIKTQFPEVLVVGLSGSDDASMLAAGASTTILKGDATIALVEFLEQLPRRD